MQSPCIVFLDSPELGILSFRHMIELDQFEKYGYAEVLFHFLCYYKILQIDFSWHVLMFFNPKIMTDG